MSFLLLEALKPVDAARYTARLQDKLGPLGLNVRAYGGEDDGDPFIVEAGPIKLSVLFVDKPLPAGTLDNAIAGNRTWPDAATALAKSRAHAIVACMDEAGDHNMALNYAAVLTLAAGALAEELPAIGVYWSTGQTVTEASRFISAADGILQKNLPLTVWAQALFLDGPPADDGGRTTACVTTGLVPFVGREIEFMPVSLDPSTIAQRVFGTMQYLLAQGPVLKDGETLGVSEAERIRIRHSDQGYHPGVLVLQLFLENLDNAGAAPSASAGQSPRQSAPAPSAGRPFGKRGTN
ncbi:DUF4261 domain-containing protein [Stappia sp. GBMRC 2046]|uniref:DUF4261 domain-containing protein n=1 Tax=Stappia sediminis TaxID=2692190 RepID=A0A7X3S8G4_9HYPH|nr:DUF4261 domain-containing protein [Stappia sediminis]MXN65821.1 DUF4261 domain-containing protein [Stappia sediminis]